MIQPERPARAVLDSDIIFSRVLHELMGRIATRLRLFDVFWSDELIAETERSLINYKGLSEEVARRWVDYLRLNFPQGRADIEGAVSHLGSLTVDPDDHHVCALCLAAGADLLFTHDRGFLRDALRDHGVAVVKPDEYLVVIFEDQPQATVELLELQASTWAGGRPLDELLDALGRAGATRFVAAVREWLDASDSRVTPIG